MDDGLGVSAGHKLSAPIFKDKYMAIVKLKFPDSVPIDQIDIPFLQGMVDRMAVGFYNYGHMRRYEVKSHSLKNVEIRLKHYRKTKNTEFLMDAANFCMMEFCVPSYSNAHFTPTTKKESPGSIVDGKHVQGKEDYSPQQKARIENWAGVNKQRKGEE